MVQRVLADAYRLLERARRPAVLACFNYWLAKRDRCGAALPGRQHLDPIEMKAFLESVILFDVVRTDGHARFRHRLNGTEFDGIFGADVTGMFIEHTGSLEHFDDLYRRFSAVADDGVLVYGMAPSPATKLNFVAYEHLTLPLATDGRTVDMLFGVRCRLLNVPTPEFGWWTAELGQSDAGARGPGDERTGGQAPAAAVAPKDHL